MTSELVPEVAFEFPGASVSGEGGTLMEVTFQKKPRHKYKYLEAEPKILGVTEIALTVFFIGWRLPFNIGASHLLNNLTMTFSSVGIIAGCVAIAAQNLHLPTLKACLGMQMVTCVAYALCVLFTLGDYGLHPGSCWHYYNYSETVHENSTCLGLEYAYSKLSMLDELLETIQIVLSVTLAVYCCKVIPCCASRSNVPTIIMAPPTASQ